jgi:hypothetical protein
MAGLKSLVGPLFDLKRILKVRARSRPLKVTAILLAAFLPVFGGAIFLWLFASANPLISEGLATLALPELDVGRVVFWVFVALPVWAQLRPRGLRRTRAAPGMEGDLDLPGVTTASITVSLIVFNALFGLQNGLDVAFLWSGAGLPDGVSFADYAHRGAYTLIATAVLAGLFVLVFLRPGSRTADSPLVRILVTVWVAQNLFLVASTVLRTLDYLEVYSLTRMRIAALLWMALVDLGAVAASWNVRHAREVGGKGVNLDLCYFGDLKGSGVVSLADLERRLPPGDFRDRVAWKRRILAADVAGQQDAWRTWRWRDARRLNRVLALTGESFQRPAIDGRSCDGKLPPLPPKPTPPLTPTPNPGT